MPQTGQENGGPLDRYRPARCEPPTHRLMAGWLGLVSRRQPERIGPHTRSTNPSIPLQLRRTGDQNGDPLGRYRPWLIADWLGIVEPAPLGEDKAPSLEHESFYTFTTNQGRKRWSPGRYRPARCGITNPPVANRRLGGVRGASATRGG